MYRLSSVITQIILSEFIRYGMYLWILLVVLVALALILRAFATKSGLIPSKKRNLTSKAVLMQEHHWEETTETGFYYCSSCDEVDGNLFNKQILTCIICGALKHSSCPSNSNIKCKSMTYGSATLFNSHQVVLQYEGSSKDLNSG